ncbi:helix-turn-helix domain-containing protein [Streptomyces specialis]|uniref:helix-turn-helix domain-containing protein n=1 Tax=Streptomyces specialis TaxID=498367 RepID=UPI00073E56CF|nr:helix-turn-helix transcriptional regulator [Streptomyces specialis]
MPQKPKALDDTVSLRAWFGVELRNWRNTRRMSTAALGRAVHLSGTAVERIEKAERPCTADLAAKFDDVLQAGGALKRLWRRVEEDADKQQTDTDNTSRSPSADRFGVPATGMLRRDPTSFEEMSPVERRAFLAAGGLAALTPTPLGELLPQIGPADLGPVVRPDDVQQVRSAAQDHARWDNLYGGGGMVRTAAIGQLIWARNLLDLTCPPQLEAELFTAVGHLAIVMGASAFDAHDHQRAVQLWEFGTQCAEHAGNWHLRALAYSWRARQAIWCGHPDAGLTHADTGLVRADRLTPREQATLHIARARAWAKMGAHQETLTAIGQADDAFSRATDGEDAPWMAYHDYAQHHGDTGHAAFDIALLPGQSPQLASDRLRTAIDNHSDAYVRSRAFSGTKLATLTMVTGDPQEAVAIAHRALDEVGHLRSKRAITDVQDLARASAKHARKPEVAGLRERIKTLIPQ